MKSNHINGQLRSAAGISKTPMHNSIESIAQLMTALFLFFCGAAASQWAALMQNVTSPTIMEQVLGPMGALALTLLALGVGWKYFRSYSERKDAELKELRDKLIQTHEEEAHYWREQATKTKQ